MRNGHWLKSAGSRQILGDELHLLCHPAHDDRIVLVEPEGERLAVQYILADTILDQGVELLLRRRTAPLRLETEDKLRNVVDRIADFGRWSRSVGLALQQRKDAEQHPAEDHEMNEGLTGHAAHGPSDGCTGHVQIRRVTLTF